MTDREKLIELIGQVQYLGGLEEQLADYLIANGVVVREWIPVTEQLPEKERSALVYFDSGNMAVGFWYEKDEYISFWQIWTDDGWLADADCMPTHWMPLPEPPADMRKGENG